jgi:hypothetical protein
VSKFIFTIIIWACPSLTLGSGCYGLRFSFGNPLASLGAVPAARFARRRPPHPSHIFYPFFTTLHCSFPTLTLNPPRLLRRGVRGEVMLDIILHFHSLSSLFTFHSSLFISYSYHKFPSLSKERG